MEFQGRWVLTNKLFGPKSTYSKEAIVTCSKFNYFLLSVLMFGQKSCLLEPTILIKLQKFYLSTFPCLGNNLVHFTKCSIDELFLEFFTRQNWNKTPSPVIWFKVTIITGQVLNNFTSAFTINLDYREQLRNFGVSKQRFRHMFFSLNWPVAKNQILNIKYQLTLFVVTIQK